MYFFISMLIVQLMHNTFHNSQKQVALVGLRSVCVVFPSVSAGVVRAPPPASRTTAVKVPGTIMV